MQNLITDILLNGRTKTWFNYAEKYNIKPEGSVMQRTKAANDYWRYYIKDTYLDKILMFDLETAPLKGYVWNLYRDSVGRKDKLIDKEYIILTWSAKWLYSNKMYNASLTKEEIENKDDSRIVKELWELVHKAHSICAHNGAGFDDKILKGRFIKHGLPQPSPYKIIDTLKVVRKHFRLPSASLDFVSEFLGLGQKLDTGGFSLWRGFMEGQQWAIDKMLKYNDDDVYLLEKLYLAVRHYITKHPNVNKKKLLKRCPACASKDLSPHGELHLSKTYKVVICNTCSATSKKTKNSLVCL